jgi:hypothetical protein
VSGLIDKLVDIVFGESNGFGRMSARQVDDPLTEKYKRLQRGAVAAILYVVGAIIFSLGTVAVLSTLEDNATFRQLGEGLRAPAGTAVFTLIGLTSLYFVYASASLYWFIRKQELGR